MKDVIYLRPFQAVINRKCKHGPEAPSAPMHDPMEWRERIKQTLSKTQGKRKDLRRQRRTQREDERLGLTLSASNSNILGGTRDGAVLEPLPLYVLQLVKRVSLSFLEILCHSDTAMDHCL